MKINKKVLRKVFADDLWAAGIQYPLVLDEVNKHLKSKGYTTYKSYGIYRRFNKYQGTYGGLVCFNIMDKCWVCLSDEIAEKIIVLNAVPNLFDIKRTQNEAYVELFSGRMTQEEIHKFLWG